MVITRAGEKIGQAVRFDRYETEDGKEVQVQGYTPDEDEAPPPPQLPPSQVRLPFDPFGWCYTCYSQDGCKAQSNSLCLDRRECVAVYTV